MLIDKKPLRWVRNDDHILTCEHGEPLHGECIRCEIAREYDSTDKAIWRIAGFLFGLAVVGLVGLLAGWWTS